jgi:serine/threonine protein kinase
MPKLAWLAIAGNPLTDSFEATHQKVQANTEIAITEAATIHGFTSMVQINWKNIEQGAKLGEGASGVIYQAKLNESIDLYTDVAIKLFKNDVTSDGLPRCEMAASIAVGLHANIVGVSGAISHHPQGVQGLIMPLISPDYVNLAQPPSLETCTRDVYAASTAFSLMQLCVIVSGVARAAAHLHACGVMHGDLYGHNILHNATGHSLLGDFGAASFLPMNDAAMSQALQRIEVRAFGILLGELLSLCVVDAMETQQHGMHRLQILQQECIQPDISARPLFTNIAQELEQCKHHIDVASSIS